MITTISPKTNLKGLLANSLNALPSLAVHFNIPHAVNTPTAKIASGANSFNIPKALFNTSIISSYQVKRK